MALVAAIQMNTTDSLQHNLKTIEKYIAEAKAAGAALVVLPEHCSILCKSMSDFQESLGDGIAQQAFSLFAKKYDIWIIIGALPILEENNCQMYSCALVYNSSGELVERYNKIHLCEVHDDDGSKPSACESHRYSAGDAVVTVETPVGIVGLSICYDLRFPELYRALVARGATVLVVPSAFLEYTGRHHWDVLLRARAIENTCYVVAPNQCGEHANGLSSYGHTQIINPWGDVISKLDVDEGCIVADIDQDFVADTRRRMPSVSRRILP